MICNRSTRRLLTMVGATLMACHVFAQAAPSDIARIIDEGKNRNQVMKHLKEITDIGPRLTSSTNLKKASDWAMKKFRSWGLQNVHLEKWGEYPVGFDRGKNHVGRMISPEAVNFEFTSPSWTEGTNGRKKGPAMYAPTSMEEFNLNKGKYKGAWLVYKNGIPRPPRQGADMTPELQARLDLETAVNSSGMLGKVYGSRNELVITSGNWRDKTFENRPKDCQIMVRKSDLDKIMASVDAGKPTILEFQLDQKFVKGPISNYNVIADIPGSEKPDEMVIVSGHLDSWDGPGSQGALDNGTGTCTAMEAARILMAAKVKPKRTIRFILWTGEEQGIFGSSQYVKDHAAELPKISAVLVDDGGTNYQGGYVGLESQREIFEAAFAPVVAAFPDMPQKFTARERMPRGGGSDHAPFNAVGVPGFFTEETGRSDYNFVHHTQHDSFKMAIPEYLVQSATNHAAVSFYLAQLPDLLPRQPAAPPPSGGGTGGGK